MTVGLEFSWRRECSPTGGYRHRAFRIRIGPAAPIRRREGFPEGAEHAIVRSSERA